MHNIHFCKGKAAERILRGFAIIYYVYFSCRYKSNRVRVLILSRIDDFAVYDRIKYFVILIENG